MKKLIVLVFCSFLYLSGGVAQNPPHHKEVKILNKTDEWRIQRELIDKLEHLNNKIGVLDKILDREEGK